MENTPTPTTQDQQEDQMFPPVPDKDVTPSWAEQEAPVVLYTTRYTPDGGWISMTMRGKDPTLTLENMMDWLKYAGEVHSISAEKPAAFQSTPTVNAPSTPQNFPPQSAQSATGAPQASQARDDSRGTDTLNKLVYAADPKTGKMKHFFDVGKFNYPFQDSRGPKIVSGLFDAELGITEAMLTNMTTWVPDVQLYVDWEKPGKYYNIVRIHK